MMPAFCKDCKFCSETEDKHHPCCVHPKSEKEQKVDSEYLVTGIPSEVKKEYYYCSTMRNHGIINCGPTAEWYQPKDGVFVTSMGHITVIDKLKTTLGII